ncbi:response regulator transcription factor [Gracilinema caldarium]|jgi:DNA-binding NarL/FixJ family response regulator|uniref:response regulator transcription factor n=1 Tax=Gracilinema caldarium TaxID=215591 RepID=UPI0026F13856|nr:response regulator transcription factor [Gracilinema caldarium]
MIKIGIVDDQDMVRDSLKILLSTQEDFEVVGIGSDGYEALKLVDTMHPDVLLLDIRMPIMDGVEATSILKVRSPQTSIIILTTFDDDEYVLNAIRNGASGYLLKSAAMDELAKAIRTVYEGGSLMTPEIATKAFRMFSEIVKNNDKRRTANKASFEFPINLNKTELEIISQIGKGLSNKEIAKVLDLKEGTVRNYISDILQKTGLRDRTQVAIFAVRHNLD